VGGHGTWEDPYSRSGATRPGVGWETWGGATHRNETISQLQGWHRGSHPSVENKGEMNQHFIHRTETTNQNSKINHDDNKTLTWILFLTKIATESGQVHNMKVIENFETFLGSTNLPSYDQRFRCYSHWNLEIVLVRDRSNYLANFGP
jgi:hypothetical protein